MRMSVTLIGAKEGTRVKSSQYVAKYKILDRRMYVVGRRVRVRLQL